MSHFVSEIATLSILPGKIPHFEPKQDPRAENKMNISVSIYYINLVTQFLNIVNSIYDFSKYLSSS